LLVLTEDEGLHAIDCATGAGTQVSGEELGSGRTWPRASLA
jgi:hypothetical protein